MNPRSIKLLLAQLFVLAVLLAGTQTAAHAQRIEFYNARGHRIGDGQPFPYDRFAHGEWIQMVVTSPSYPIEIVGTVNNGHVFFYDYSGGRYSCWFQVPTDPLFGNCWFHAHNVLDDRWVSKRLPIGPG